MNELFIDIETSGLPMYELGKLPHYKNLIKYENCRILEICIVLFVDKKLKTFFHKIINVDFNIENSIIHGITNDISKEKGSLFKDIYIEILDLINESNIIISHNVMFDISCLFSELYRIDNSIDFIKIFKSKLIICTMLSSINVCKLPHLYSFDTYKYPKLDDLYDFFFKNQRINKHTAKFDTLDLIKCYNELCKLNINFITVNNKFLN